MAHRARLSPRDCVVWVIVIGGHVLLLVLFSRAGDQAHGTFRDRSADSTVWLVIAPQLPDEVEPLVQEKEPARRAAKSRVDDAPRGDTAITVPQPTPPVDWYLEAEAAARAAIEKEAQPGPRRFGEQPSSPYRKCKRHESSFVWNPEPDKTGFDGGLPWVRLGKRCIVGLGFFGCGLGKLPEANAGLFADMHDPDRLTSSVPELEDCRP